MPMRRDFLWCAVVGACAIVADARADATVSFSLVPAGPLTVPSGAVVTLEVRATFNTRLSAAAFTLGGSGSSTVTMVSRSANPTDPNGLTFVSRTSQDPFENGLPLNLTTTPVTEVLYDADFGPAPGGANDGLPAGMNVVLAQVGVRLTGAGSATVTLSAVMAAHTTGPPNGAMFDVMSIGVPSVTYTVQAPCGDGDNDGDVDLIDWGVLQDCFTGAGNTNTNPACDPMDCDGDDDIDLDDYTTFQLVVGG